ncbi:hypothetical protein P3T76_001553 [Phytophthora citrophthora]|uniref:RxLR effector protein n=1 Tax=Phytophthora citrophthora TaxID=4793 RepID=A0AAD9LS36_9STRA|nr:hypothetical protein P3T76_001553 [Phytophthora citrophthora]
MKFSRLHVVALLLVAMISTSGGTQIVGEQAPGLLTAPSSRHLRTIKDVPRDAKTEERAPNIDILISDAAKKVKKATWWKVKFAVWKYLLGKNQHDVRGDLGMRNMGREALYHKNNDQLAAFWDFYGKGPLKYDQL